MFMCVYLLFLLLSLLLFLLINFFSLCYLALFKAFLSYFTFNLTFFSGSAALDMANNIWFANNKKPPSYLQVTAS